MPTGDEHIYWAADSSDKLANQVFDKVKDYYRFIENNGLLRKWRKSYDTYHGFTSTGLFASSADVAAGGEQGELTLLKVNHYRNLVTHMLRMVTSNRPALEAKAANSDFKSKAQTLLANGILGYYMRDKRIERYLKTATEHALIFGEGFLEMQWDVNLGNPYGVDPDSGKTLNEGDVRLYNPIGPLDVVRDPNLRDAASGDWAIVTERINKFDLMAQYPDKANDIYGLSGSSIDNQYGLTGDYLNLMSHTLVPVRRFYHKKTPALPNGRLTILASPTIVLFDGPIPYGNLPNGLPLMRIAPANYIGTPFGYSPAWDILGLSELHDSLYSTIATNQVTFGVQNVLVPKGHDIGYQQLTGGLNLIEFDPKVGKPEALNLTKSPPEVFSFLNKVEQTEGLLLGINDVVRGDPQASLKSGSALALVASQSLQFNSGLQESYIALLEDTGTCLIQMLQTFANTKRMASLAGRNDRFTVKEFSKSDLGEINRVIVDVTNPLSRTTEGRLEMARDLLQVPGLIKHTDEYLQILETGSFESLVQGPEDELLTIDAENEMLQQAQSPTAVITDDHALHVREHKAVLSTPDSRQNPAVVKAVTEHIMSHINLMANADPRVLLLTDQKPLPPPPAPPAPPGPPPQGAPAAPPHGAPPNVPPPPMPGQPPVQQQFPQPGAPTSLGQPQQPAMNLHGAAALFDGRPALQKAASHVRQANMPKNPQNGIREPLPGGPLRTKR